jgi:hypothetical protein
LAVQAGLIAVGAQPGSPVQFQPEFKPASGPEVEVTVYWNRADGEVQQARGQDWVRSFRTKEAMTHPWVFAGSGFWKDETTGTEYFQAESGDLICVSNFPSAMLDLPVSAPQANAELLFEAFQERIPKPGTRVTMVLAPKLDATPKPNE